MTQANNRNSKGSTGAAALMSASRVFVFLLSTSLCLVAMERQVPVTKSGSGMEDSKKIEHPTTKISYEDGKLTIDARDTTLPEVLSKVASVLGLTIELPEGTTSELRPLFHFGPGPAREILATLLTESNFDYLIQASDSDEDKLQSVLLMPRKKTGKTNTEAPELAGRRPRPGQQPPPAETPEPEPAIQVVAANTPADTTPSAPPPQHDAIGQPALGQQSLADATARPGALSPPSTMNSQNINQQLQQMYQQRVQMMQQTNPSLAAPVQK